MPRRYLAIGKTRILNLIPNQFIKPPKFIQSFLFGTENKKLLNAIIEDTSPEFIRWALQKLIEWNNDTSFKEILRIHGTKDKLIPLKGEATQIKDGGHFMVVDKAIEISAIINQEIESLE